MPPALSDYGSDGELTTVFDSRFQVRGQAPNLVNIFEDTDNGDGPSVTHLRRPENWENATGSTDASDTEVLGPLIISKKQVNGGSKQFSAIQLDLDDIIPSLAGSSLEEDTSPTSSLEPLTSTRSLRHPSGPHELIYNQKYHPMDDVLQPTRAARVKLTYTTNAMDDCSESETDHNDENKRHRSKGKKRLHSVPPSPYATVSLSRGERRSSRRSKRKVNYDMKVHPQDSQLRELEAESYIDTTHSARATKRTKIHYLADTDDDLDVEYNGDDDQDADNELQPDNHMQEEGHGTEEAELALPDPEIEPVCYNDSDEGSGDLREIPESAVENEAEDDDSFAPALDQYLSNTTIPPSGERQINLTDTTPTIESREFASRYSDLFRTSRTSIDVTLQRSRRFRIFEDRSNIHALPMPETSHFPDDDDKENIDPEAPVTGLNGNIVLPNPIPRNGRTIEDRQLTDLIISDGATEVFNRMAFAGMAFESSDEEDDE
ncbi:hypothetical protein B0J11DRAFT_510329 [Dendryphion nanum]|uniref:Uncharacterized protein n=1 Tax=Dendryphion nanum TaxID=256645 RepID=A0A9P9DBV6_9PLEO|nr:hypothetical protein B0J11DRAFT_510329 [Dendryphion nanum]